MRISVTINGKKRIFDTAPGERVLHLLRRYGILSVKNGCDGEGTCGVCAILLDGKVVNSCQLLAPQIDGHEIKTSECLSQKNKLHPIQEAFLDTGIVQCGYCTPAMLVAAYELLQRKSEPTEEDIKDAFSGIICRCTGYKQIFDAIEVASKRIKGDENYKKEYPAFRSDLRLVGKSTRKVDGQQLVCSNPSFVEDMINPNTLYVKVLRSPHAHAIIKSIDVSDAEKIEGVEFILTHENCPHTLYGSSGQCYPEPSPYDRRIINKKMRFVGDRVAAVAATSEEIAMEALNKIKVEYEILPAILSLEQAINEPSVQIHDETTSEYCFHIGQDLAKNIAASNKGGIGDIEKGFKEADVIIERTYRTGHIQCTPLEPHVVYTYMEGDRLVIRASTQVPFHLRRIVSRATGYPEIKIHVIKERVGGGFGAKQDVVMEELSSYITLQTGKPVYHRFTREEEFIASRTRHPTIINVKVGANKQGQITAVDMKVQADTGAYGPHCLTVPMNACSKTLPLLRCKNMSYDVTVYYTNNIIAGAYQGYGAPSGAFALQTALAETATALKINYLTFIRLNHVRTGDRLDILKCLGEGQEGIPQQVTSCALSDCLDRGDFSIRWGEKEDGTAPYLKIGKGFAIIQQGSGLPGIDAANASIYMLGDGTFFLCIGGADLGTGLDTVAVKVVAEILMVDQDKVAVKAGDTDVTPFDVGSYASSGTYFTGAAAYNAALNMKKKILEESAKILNVSVDKLTLDYPGKVVSDDGELTYTKLAQLTQSGKGTGQIIATGTFTTEESPIPYGAHFAKVEVNELTGTVKVKAFHAYQDCGTPINPDLALGQMYGAVIKSIGHTLYEQMIFDEKGKCLNPNFLDYKVPTINDIPEDFRSELVFVDEKLGPFGGKSISEIATNGAAPAIATAIYDATGVWVREYPFTAEKVLEAIREKKT
ncbi:MAG TPA: molybdopterin-dependent oxidoreductase [Candidatus Eremiobacteraeota bacterium]|nr:molybdopterin-dependent oxidoreductase [Candidatus Eremiobacteraeota bacterium]